MVILEARRKSAPPQNGGPERGGPSAGTFVSLLPPRRHEQRSHLYIPMMQVHMKIAVEPRSRLAWSSSSFPPKEQTQNAQGGRESTYGLRRLELPLRMTSTPPRPAAAMTAFWLPKSMPTTDMVAGCGGGVCLFTSLEKIMSGHTRGAARKNACLHVEASNTRPTRHRRDASIPRHLLTRSTDRHPFPSLPSIAKYGQASSKGPTF